VKTKLTTDRVKNLVSVNVDTKDGVVHLKGTVPNEQAKAEAERLAKDTDGVVSVTNRSRFYRLPAITVRSHPIRCLEAKASECARTQPA
jgi:hypothetical protein